jgi:hypothetical protein
MKSIIRIFRYSSVTPRNMQTSDITLFHMISNKYIGPTYEGVKKCL